MPEVKDSRLEGRETGLLALSLLALRRCRRWIGEAQPGIAQLRVVQIRVAVLRGAINLPKLLKRQDRAANTFRKLRASMRHVSTTYQ